MGGIGSGSAPRSARRTTNRLPALDVAQLTRGGAFACATRDVPAVGELTLTHAPLWPHPVTLRVALQLVDDRAARLVCDDDAGATLAASLEATAQPFGGVRWWARCGLCARRCRVLYVATPSGAAPYFACRRCLGLDYPTQRMGDVARWQTQAAKIHARLDGPRADGLLYPAKGMHWRTFHRLMDRADVYEAAAHARTARALARLAERIRRRSSPKPTRARARTAHTTPERAHA